MPHAIVGSRHRDAPSAMMDWFVGNCTLLGPPCQNWMWVFGLGLVLYIVVLAIGGRRQTD